jgi:hypothetical protein
VSTTSREWPRGGRWGENPRRPTEGTTQW